MNESLKVNLFYKNVNSLLIVNKVWHLFTNMFYSCEWDVCMSHCDNLKLCRFPSQGNCVDFQVKEILAVYIVTFLYSPADMCKILQIVIPASNFHHLFSFSYWLIWDIAPSSILIWSAENPRWPPTSYKIETHNFKIKTKCHRSTKCSPFGQFLI